VSHDVFRVAVVVSLLTALGLVAAALLSGRFRRRRIRR
jgi:hypothetical protein